MLWLINNDMEYISRSIEPTVLEMSNYFPVIVITGPRQSGKTTLINHLFNNYMQFSMEDLHVREFAEQDPVAFLEQNEHGMIIDEVQRVPALMSYIQGIVDKDSSRHFILSGSSNFSMLQSVTQSLAGRAAILELLPMSISEIGDLAATCTIDELIFAGMYPAVCAHKIPPELAYPSYVKTYLERDVRNLLRVSNLSAYERFLKLCAGRIGSLFVASQLANEVGVSTITIKSWLSVLQASYVITLLPPYYENLSKRLVKTPKLYFNDTGIACYLLDIESPQQLARDKMRGPLFENLIVMEAIKYRMNQGKQSNAYFYRDSNQNEIDLLLKNGQNMNGIEIKSSMTYHRDFDKSLRNMSKYVMGNIQQRAVVYAGQMENRLGEIQLINYLHLDDFLT